MDRPDCDTNEHAESPDCYACRKPSVAVGGVWLRKVGQYGLEVLTEVGGQWRVVISEKWPADGQGEISHIVEPTGIMRAPRDKA